MNKVSNPTIDAIWTYSNTQKSESFKILPDNCADVIFDLSDNKIFASGVMNTCRDQQMGTDVNLIGVRFKAEYFSQMTSVPISATINAKMELSELYTVNEYVIDQLHDCASLREQLALVYDFVLKVQSKLSAQNDELVNAVAKLIRTSKGALNIKELATNHCISLRQLERRFKVKVGLTLKEFSGIVRFNHSRKAIEGSRKQSLQDIAFDMGYYDHAHMANDFKRISGVGPSYFR